MRGLERNSLRELGLSVIAAHRRPIGAAAFAERLAAEGVSMSPASAGRLLAELEGEGFLEQESNKGRVLSERGRLLVQERQQREGREVAARRFLDELSCDAPEKIIEVLVARRAIERETCRLAAERAKEQEMEEIATFAAILDTSQHVSREHVAVVDRKFHQAIARAGGNRVLAAALDLIFRDKDLLAMTMSFRKRRDALLQENGHRAIAEAIARRDPDEAEKALLRHLGYIIGAVEALAEERGDEDRGAFSEHEGDVEKIQPVCTLDKEETIS
ncbi:FadR/GntR family transcriptional regulator [Aminiphilus circumscriptus]|uniref:FadR/GntR family transcriptional regulator n=1 Tax=Aminiphilus circumscriptus TaxID=290732 RepID=UPI00146F9B6D|nr:FCD domain-containing protein [Aminiphilus circumscriptus]